MANYNPQDPADMLQQKCFQLAHNLWWSWHSEVSNLFRDIDPIRFRQVDHNPIALLREFTPERLDLRASEMFLHSRVNYAYRRLQEYLAVTNTWAAKNAGILGARPVAYISVEFGMHESLPIYSGNLGLLSGDHIKSASDLGIPLVGIGLYYSHGYFKQHLDHRGYQREEYIETKVANQPIETVTGPDNKPLSVSIDTRDGKLLARVQLLRVGRVNLYLLDCDVPENRPEDRTLTSRLYGGDERTRLRQEIVLGVGGVRLLNMLNITPGLFHLNGGHSALAVLEAIRQRMSDDSSSFENAVREVSQMTCFTTHSTGQDSDERFDGELIEEHLGPLRDQIQISHGQLMGLGRVDTDNPKERFSMTVLALKLSRKANGLNSLHGRNARRTWKSLWPDRAEEHVPIGHITAGAHLPTWLAWQMAQLFDRYFPPGWRDRSSDPEIWQCIYGVDLVELWETHCSLKDILRAFTRRRVSRQFRRRGESDEAIERTRTLFEPNVLTIGYRYVEDIPGNSLFSDVERLIAIVSSMERPVQFVCMGKVSPRDEAGKLFVQQIHMLSTDPTTCNRIAFIEDEDMNVCRHLVQGVDVWLCNSKSQLKPSDTTGQKAAVNGGLNLSVLDSWWAEAYDGRNGFAIGIDDKRSIDEIVDSRETEATFSALEKEVIPAFYERDADGVPRKWVTYMLNSISSIAWRFDAHRMLQEYTKKVYLPLATRTIDDADISFSAHSGGVFMKTPSEIVESLKAFRHDHPDPSRVAFIAMPFAPTKAHDGITSAIKNALAKVGVAAFRADDKWYHDDLFSNVLTYIYGCGFVVAIFERIQSDDFNPNVSLEVGYGFALGKPLCLFKDKTLRRLPTDLVGKLYREFDPQDPGGTIETELLRWMKDKKLA